MNMGKYYTKLWGGASFVLGVYFLVEHLIVWGKFEFHDFPWGHEWLGLLLMLIGILPFVEWKKK